MGEITNLKKHPNNIISFTAEITWLPGIDTGWGNGYIGLPAGHEDYGKHCNEIDRTEPDFGWTYSEEQNIEIDGAIETYWVIGFDTAHMGQNKENWPESRVVSHVEEMAAAFI